jgi:hypothetical protein
MTPASRDATLKKLRGTLPDRCALSVLFAAPLAAQNAELSGLITDPAGLAVPAAKVTVQSADTGAVRTLASNQQAVLGNWSMDSIIYARSAPPLNVVTGLDPFPAGVQTGALGAVRPNVIPGVPLWIANPNVADGREINPAAFVAESGAGEGDLGRNALRGFDAVEVDLTVRRQFRLRERLALKARADLFNLFNHPNFGSPILSHFAAVRAVHADAGRVTRGRRSKRGTESSLSDRRAAFGAACSKAFILSARLFSRRFPQTRAFQRASP